MGSNASGRRVLVVHNPSAGVRQPPTERWMSALACLGEVRRLSLAEVSVDEALREPAELVVAAGGDGTFGRVARRLAGSDRPLAVVPLGTANNVARHLGLALDPSRAAAQLARAEERRMDVGVAIGSFGTRLYFEGAGLGLLADDMPALTACAHATEFTSAEQKIATVRAELAHLLAQAATRAVHLELDGRALAPACLALEALNIESVGPRLALAPGADAGDGSLDVVTIEARHRAWLGASLGAADGKGRGPVVRRAREVRLEWSGGPLHVDDALFMEADPSARAIVTLTVRPGALRVLAPARGASPSAKVRLRTRPSEAPPRRAPGEASRSRGVCRSVVSRERPGRPRTQGSKVP